MKKSKIVSALMALALTVSPLSGIGGFKSITDSPVTVSAACPMPGEPESVTVDPVKEYYYGFSGQTILNNHKGAKLILAKDGSLILNQRYLLLSPYNAPGIKDPRTGAPIESYMITLQADGNLVVYNNTDRKAPSINRALYHTNSYYGSEKAKKYLASQLPKNTYKKISPIHTPRFTITDDGHLIIRCCYKVVTLNNKTEFKWVTAWDSRHDSIDRVI